MTTLTEDEFRRLVMLATHVALDAPLRHPAYGPDGRKAGVWWSTVDEARAICDAFGIDWRKHHRSTRTKGVQG